MPELVAEFSSSAYLTDTQLSRFKRIPAEVDALLIAGDLFDHNRVPDETIAFAQQQFPERS